MARSYYLEYKYGSRIHNEARKKMHKMINAYVLIDTIMRENGIEPIEECLGVSWKSEHGYSMVTRAIDFKETGLEFDWSLGIFRVDEFEMDAVATLSFGAEIDDIEYGAEDEGISRYPSLEITYRASTDAWTVEFDSSRCSWPNGGVITTAAKMLGLVEINTDGMLRVPTKVLSEVEVREAIAKLAKHVKEQHLTFAE